MKQKFGEYRSTLFMFSKFLHLVFMKYLLTDEEKCFLQQYANLKIKLIKILF